MAALALAVASTVTGAATRAYSIVYGDTLNEIASKHGTDVATLVGLNDLGDPDMIIAGDEINVPDGDLTTYTIQEGDTLAGIAASYGVDIQELIAVNKIDDPDLIRPGNVLMIYLPVEGSESPASDEAVDSDDEATEPANAESTKPSTKLPMSRRTFRTKAPATRPRTKLAQRMMNPRQHPTSRRLAGFISSRQAKRWR
ncbi:MAG: LysM peptidoglycan-binding domain-containing protein [Thermomicrobiales bacterium]